MPDTLWLPRPPSPVLLLLLPALLLDLQSLCFLWQERHISTRHLEQRLRQRKTPNSFSQTSQAAGMTAPSSSEAALELDNEEPGRSGDLPSSSLVLPSSDSLTYVQWQSACSVRQHISHRPKPSSS
jgi:hypothetical protein